MWINESELRLIVNRISDLEYKYSYWKEKVERHIADSERGRPFWDKVLAHIGVKCEWVDSKPGSYELVILKKKRGKK